MTLRFHRLARLEIDAAALYYEAEQDGLGVDFSLAVADGIDQIIEWPNAWPRVEAGCRRYRLGKFAYGIVYKTYPDRIAIIAVAHLSRAPGYWADRVE